MTLFALYKDDNNISFKKVPLTQTAERDVINLFESQCRNFFDGNDIIVFDGNWKPEEDELFVLDLHGNEQISMIHQIIDENSSTIENFNVSDVNNLKAFFIKSSSGDILFQKFQKAQFVSRTLLSLIIHGSEPFDTLTEPTLSFDSKLVCVLRNYDFYFKNYTSVRPLLSLKGYYEEATESDINSFCGQMSLSLQSKNILSKSLTENIRKRIHSIIQKNVLQRYTVQEIKEKAEETDLSGLITIVNGEIELPNDKKKILAILSFLDEKLFKGWDSQEVYITNSTRSVE